MHNIKSSLQQWWHVFKVRLAQKRIRYCMTPAKTLTFHFADMPITLGIWKSNFTANLLFGDSNLPAAVFGARPVHSTIGIAFGVFVNDNFLTQSNDLQAAVCLHELGHIYHQHMQNPKYRAINGVLVDPIAEYEADGFAVGYGHGTYLSEALKTLEDRYLIILEENLPKHKFLRPCFFETVQELQKRRRLVDDLLSEHAENPFPKLHVRSDVTK